MKSSSVQLSGGPSSSSERGDKGTVEWRERGIFSSERGSVLVRRKIWEARGEGKRRDFWRCAFSGGTMSASFVGVLCVSLKVSLFGDNCCVLGTCVVCWG